MKKEQEEPKEKNLSFEQWLDCFCKEPTSKELDQMYLESKKRNINSYAKNNPFYFPIKGA